MTGFTLAANPYLSGGRRTNTNARVNCKEKERLREEYEDAERRLGALERVGYGLDEAHRGCRDAMAALQTHLLLHGCDQAGNRPRSVLQHLRV